MNKCGINRIQCNSCEKLVCCKACHLKQSKSCSFEGNEAVLECSNCKKYIIITENEDCLTCSSCNYNLGYVCVTCKVVLAPSEELDYYHCTQCKTCFYKTKGILFEHCKVCDMDMPLDHKCYDIDKCLICLKVRSYNKM